MALDDRENAAERQAKRKGTRYQPSVKREMRWGYWTQMKAEEALSHLKNVVFPGLVELADEKSSFGDASRMKGAQCKINKAGLPVLSNVEGLIEACNLIDQMKIAEQNQDVQGDLYEYMLGHMQFAPCRGSATGRSA
jgi:type I restriction enzyme M protein